MKLSSECILMLNQLDKPAFFAEDNIIIQTNRLAGELGFSVKDALTDKFDSLIDGDNFVFTNCLNNNYYTVSVSSIGTLKFYILEPSVNQEFLNALTGIALNLRDPMSGFIYSLDNIKQLVLDEGSPKSINSLRNATRNFFSLQRSVRNMSDIGNILNADKTQKENVNITAYFNEQVEKLTAYLSHSGVRITCSIPNEPLYCAINKELIERALYNMISNSLNAKSDNIHITLTQSEKALNLTVSDDGTGMSQEQKANILRKFQKTPSFSIQNQNFGFGMLIIHATAVYHNGTILIADAEPKGCKITLSFELRETTELLRQNPAVIKSDSLGGADHLLMELAKYIHPDDFI